MNANSAGSGSVEGMVTGVTRSSTQPITHMNVMSAAIKLPQSRLYYDIKRNTTLLVAWPSSAPNVICLFRLRRRYACTTRAIKMVLITSPKRSTSVRYVTFQQTQHAALKSIYSIATVRRRKQLMNVATVIRSLSQGSLVSAMWKTTT